MKFLPEINVSCGEERGHQRRARAGRHQGGEKAGVREDEEQALGRREIGHQGGRRVGIRRRKNRY